MYWLENVLIEEQSGLPSRMLEERKSQKGMTWRRESEGEKGYNKCLDDVFMWIITNM